MTTSEELLIDTMAVRLPHPFIRATTGSVAALADSIRDDGLRHPITLWSDGTLISGLRRHRAHLVVANKSIRAVFVDTIEDAAKRLQIDHEDDHEAVPMKPSELCRLWELLRTLDGPDALVRNEAARRRGVELRRATKDGKRRAGRSAHRTDDYALGVLAPAFGMSEATAGRVWAIYAMATGISGVRTVTEERREIAQDAMRSLDAGQGTVWANYARVMTNRTAPVAVPRQTPPSPVAVDAAKQIAAWNRSLPTLEGLVAGLVELGPPNTALTAQEIEPVHARLKVVRRNLEKIINQMRETTKP